MRLNVKSDDFKLEVTTLLKKQIYVSDLENFLKSKFTINSNNSNDSSKSNLVEETFKLYDIDLDRILRKTETINILGKKELNLKLLKHFIYDNEVPFIVNRPKIEDMISEITGAQGKLKRENKKSKISNKSKNSLNYLNYLNYPFNSILSEEEIIQNFEDNYQNTTVDESFTLELIHMGFDEARSKLALMLAKNNLAVAADMLLDQNFENYYSTMSSLRLRI